MRIFLGLGDLGGYYSRLEDGLRAIGVDCTRVDAFPIRDYVKYHHPGPTGRLVEWIGRCRAKAPRGSLRRLGWKVLQVFGLAALMVESLFTCDVFVFAGGTSFLSGADLPLLRFFGKRIITVYHGSDSRPPYVNGAYVGGDITFDARRCLAQTRQIHRWVRWVDRFSDVILTHPYATHFNRKPVVNFVTIGIPIEPMRAFERRASRHSCVIVHAPTRPVQKGSREIEAVVERLRARGHDLTLVKIVNRPPQDVLDALRDCDFVFDELYSDTPMAGFATEAAAMGKAAVVGLHDADTLRHTVPPHLFPPVHSCHPDDLEAAIEKLVVDVEYRERLGAEARAFVEQHWSHRAVAERIRQLAIGAIPPEWWFDPADLRYVDGWGLTTTRLKDVISGVVAVGGLDALHISDKPELEDRFADLAGVPRRLRS